MAAVLKKVVNFIAPDADKEADGRDKWPSRASFVLAAMVSATSIVPLPSPNPHRRRKTSPPVHVKLPSANPAPPTVGRRCRPGQSPPLPLGRLRQQRPPVVHPLPHRTDLSRHPGAHP